MKILVGTLFCGEHEFDRCVESISRQTLPATEHLVIRNRPDREAHQALYGGFFGRREEFDLLIKVDADCVICRDDFFAKVAATFRSRPDLRLLEVKLHDWYTDRPMSGINIYHRDLDYRPSGDGVFTDRFAVDPSVVHRDRKQLAPAAMHCPDPSPWHAFHFGVHRGVKGAVALQRGLYETAYMRFREVHWTRQHFRRNPDPRLGLAALGGELGLAGQFKEDQLDYSNAAVQAAYRRAQSADADTLKRMIEEAVDARLSRWPWWVRMELKRGGRLRWGRAAWPLPLRKAMINAGTKLRSLIQRSAAEAGRGGG